MATLKTFYNEALIKDLGSTLSSVYPAFQADAFTKRALDGLEEMEFMARAMHITEALWHVLPKPYAEAVKILLEAMGPADDTTGGVEGMGGFRWLPWLNFVSKYGHDDLELSLDALGEMTLHFSAEFAIRSFLIAAPKETLKRVTAWSKDPDWRRRRLASEGTRPRLPWGQQLGAFVKDPTPVLALLGTMYEDESLVVRRSVANHLNDIAKDHPDLAARTAATWMKDASKEGAWTVKHGMRTLVKQGHSEALRVLGFHGGEHVAVEGLKMASDEVLIGEKSSFSLTLHSKEKHEVKLVVDYVLERMLKGGKSARKVFKLGVLDLAPGGSKSYEKSIAFAQLSTRTYYPGTHAIEVLINGRCAARTEFELS